MHVSMQIGRYQLPKNLIKNFTFPKNRPFLYCVRVFESKIISGMCASFSLDIFPLFL